MAETNNNRLGIGDKALIETGNDIVTKMRKLREAQKNASKYEQEQIAWEILSLTRRLNDKTIDEMELHAKNEIAAKEYAPVGELKNTLDTYLADICALRDTMKLARQAQDASSKEAIYKIFAAQELMNAKVKETPEIECAPDKKPSESIPSSAAVEPVKDNKTKQEAKKEVVPNNGYNHEKAFKVFKNRIEAVQKKLAKSESEADKSLLPAINAYVQSPDALTTVALQKALISLKQGILSDGKFGNNTMGALESVVGIKSEKKGGSMSTNPE